ncbi:MAG: hypothetical protein IJL32_07240 [Oscillospiraceae bacterium]|nr:hypothetical protein [Oscillospiraceae bacterium]
MYTVKKDQPWARNMPYTRMLAQYEQAAKSVHSRIVLLRAELRQLRRSRLGTAESARTQTVLEKRIALLCEEHTDLLYAMCSIRVYAEKEVC